MAGFALVSHCYRRPTYDDWPYSIFTMVHGKNAKDCEATIAAIHDETGVDEYALLWSIKEYKKTRVRYYTDDWDDWRAAHLTSAVLSDANLIDVDRVRADTPGCRDVVHLNNAGASLPPRVVVDTVSSTWSSRRAIGGYAAADAVAARLGGGLRLGGGAARRRASTRSRWWRTRPARGTWRSTRWRRRSPPATGSSPHGRSTRAT